METVPSHGLSPGPLLQLALDLAFGTVPSSVLPFVILPFTGEVWTMASSEAYSQALQVARSSSQKRADPASHSLLFLFNTSMGMP